MLWRKLKAGALQLTLFIAVVVSLLLMAFILLVQTHKRFRIQTDFIIETSRNTDKGIDYALSITIKLHDTLEIPLNDEDYKTLKLTREFWGIFEKATSVSKIKNNRIEKSALIGGLSNDKQKDLALYLKDDNKPLMLVGNTRIEGLVYVPERGVKSGTIAGNSYYGSQLIYGNTRISNNLPRIFTETTTQLKSLETSVLKTKENQFLNIEAGKTYKNSFFDPTQIVFSNSEIVLDNINIIGNIIIQSKSKIIIESSSTLKDIVIIAPEIEIKDNVKGNFQVISSNQLIVGENVELDYPSALILNEKMNTHVSVISQTEDLKKIDIGSNSTVKGLVLFLGQSKPNNYNVQLELNEKATVIGEVYCNQNMELKGTVYGSVFTNNFIARQFGSVYQNHIYNGTIIANKLPEEYIGLSFNNSKKGIVKWLY